MWLLTCPIVILNLYELVVVLLAFPLKLDGIPQLVVVSVVLAIIVAVGVGKVLFAVFPRMQWWAWWLFAPLLTGACLGSILGVLFPAFGDGDGKPRSHYRLLALEWAALVAWLLYRLLRVYARTRDRAGGVRYLTGGFAGVVGAAAVLCFSINVFRGPDSLATVYQSGIHTFELLFVTVTAAWILLFVVILLQSGFLLLAFFRSGPEGKRAAWTVLISVLRPRPWSAC